MRGAILAALLALPPAPGGAPLKAADLKGKAVLLDFWTTYCEPCRDAEPYIGSLQKRFGERGLVVLAVDEGEDAKTVAAGLKARPTSLRVFIDKDGALARRFHVRKQPALVLFDLNGELQSTAVGFSPSSKADLEWRVDRLLPPENGSVPVGAFERSR